jgi:hypothetical protein
MNRSELCQRLIEEARKCLGSGDRECVLRKIEELVRANCHDGRILGKEVAGKVKGIVHELWLVSDNELRCKLLRTLRELGVTKKWVRGALKMNRKDLDKKWRTRCNIEWGIRIKRRDIVKRVEGLLRERFGWSETRMCETLLKYIGVDTEAFRKYGIEPCDWVHAGFDDIYLMGIILSDSHIEVVNNYVEIQLGTTNTIGAVFFLSLLREPSLSISWFNGKTRLVEVRYLIVLGKVDKWGWVNREELIKRVRALRPEDVPRLIAGAVDGDGSISYDFDRSRPFINIVSCKACEKRIFLDALQEALRKLGIEGKIYESSDSAVLEVYGKEAVKLLRLITPHLRHPLKHLRAKLILMLHDRKIDYDTFAELYSQTMYEDRNNDPKRCRAIDILAQAAPQTHTHGSEQNKN